jgi:phosphomannomutase
VATLSGLVISYSGVRGVVGRDLDPSVARRFGVAFRRMVAELHPTGPVTLVIGRDTRASGPELQGALMQGLADERVRILDLEVAPTPTIQFALGALKAQGAAVVTASHNPAQWNGFKFFLAPANTVLDGAQTERLVRELALAPDAAGTIVRDDTMRENRQEQAVALHVARVLEQVDAERIRRRGFRVALDAARGAGELPALRLLDALGCAVTYVGVARESEPVAENLAVLRAAVVQNGCAVGFALDLDADRLALVTEAGIAPGEETTLVLVVDHLLRRAHASVPVVVKNISTTRAVDDVVARAGAELIETRVGEVNLSRALKRALDQGRVAFGGEGNGGVILPAVHLGRDSLVGMALVLEALAQRGEPLSIRLRNLPRYHTAKLKLPLGRDPALLMAAVERAFPEGAVDRLDGLRLRFADGAWIGVRRSNTEPIVRLVVESMNEEWVARVVNKLQNV